MLVSELFFGLGPHKVPSAVEKFPNRLFGNFFEKRLQHGANLHSWIAKKARICDFALLIPVSARRPVRI